MLEKKSSAPQRKRSEPFARPQASAGASVRLRARRRTLRRVFGIVALVVLLGVAALLVWGLWQPAVRVQHIDVFGTDAPLVDMAQDAMRGTYLGVIPRNSIFFLPEHAIRAEILTAHSEIAAVSIFRQGFTGISIRVSERVPVARWCGLAKSPEPADAPYCYVFDANGYLYAPADAPGIGALLNAATLYAPLESDTEEPLRATVAHANRLPSVFDFARQIPSAGGVVTDIEIRGDEVDDTLQGGTRLTYLLGDESRAFAALMSAKGQYNLADGSVEYLDLRFDGKIYLKKSDKANSL